MTSDQVCGLSTEKHEQVVIGFAYKSLKSKLDYTDLKFSKTRRQSYVTEEPVAALSGLECVHYDSHLRRSRSDRISSFFGRLRGENNLKRRGGVIDFE